MNNRKQRVLIVDDNEDVREPLAEWLERAEGLAVQTAASGEDALRLIQETSGKYDVILMDEVLPGIDGIETMRRIRADFPNIQVIMFTGVAPEAGVKALREGAYRYIMKPIDNDEIAILLRHISEVQQLEQRLVEEGKLIEATRRIAEHVASVPKQQLLQEVANVGQSLLDVPVCIVWELDRDNGMLKVAAWAGEVDEEYRRTVQIDSQSNATKAFLEARRPLAFEDVRDASIYVHRKETRVRNWVSLLTAPMIAQNRVIGMLDAYSYSRRSFAPWEKELLATFAAQAALAIGQTSLIQHMQEVSRLALTGDYTRLASYVTEAVNDLTGASVALWMIYEKENVLRIQAGWGLPTKYAANAILPVEPGSSITAIALRDRRPVSGRDVLDQTEEPRFYHMEDEVVKKQGWRSFLAVPLLGQAEKPLGALTMYGAEPRDFSESETALLSTFANQAAIAFENTRLLETLEEQVEERTHQLQEEHKRRLAVESWATLGKAAGNLLHRINNTTGIIPVAAQSLRELLEGVPIDDDRRRDITADLDRIERNSRYTLQFARGLWKPFDALPTERHDVSVLLEEAISIADIPANVHLETQLDGNLPMVSTSHLLTDVFVELITNAVKAMPDGGRLTIAGKRTRDDHVEIRFSDTGGGIPSENLEKIFDLFFTTDENSLGFGLWWVKTFLTSQGGNVDVKSREGKGTTFTIRLPIEGPRALAE